MGGFGDLFAKPFSRFAACMGVYILIFGLVAIIENSSSSGTFFFFSILFAITFLGLAIMVSKSDRDDFSESRNYIYVFCIGVIVILLGVAGGYVQRAPTTRADNDNTVPFTAKEKEQVWAMWIIGSLASCLIIFYTTRFGDSIDQYNRNNIRSSDEMVEKIANELNQLPAALKNKDTIFGIIVAKLYHPFQQIHAVNQSRLDPGMKSDIIELIRHNNGGRIKRFTKKGREKDNGLFNGLGGFISRNATRALRGYNDYGYGNRW
jgi:hypothetical protein